MTFGEKVESLNLQDSYDYAYPVDWARDVLDKTGLWPHGVIWLYDKEGGLCGRPYPVTLHAYQIMKLYELELTKKKGVIYIV